MVGAGLLVLVAVPAWLVWSVYRELERIEKLQREVHEMRMGLWR